MRRCLPAEWHPQEAIQLTWPHNGTDWADTLEEVTNCYINIAREIALRQKLWIVAPQPQRVKTVLETKLPGRALANISYFRIPSNDTWTRDHAFITILREDGVRELLDFRFNAWGGKFEASLDNDINRELYDMHFAADGARNVYVSQLDFELEGGSIESDGVGTILTTAQCNQNANRRGNHSDSEETLTQELCRRLGAERVLWLHHGGLERDDTDAHIDTLARFCPDDTIVYCEGCQGMLTELQSFRTMQGKPYRLVPVPPYYANFLIMNTAVLLPFYENEENNLRAKMALETVFPDREVIGIDCGILLTQNGSLHCCTMQYPLLQPSILY
ncbi:MAG: agmatine deiminase family protein [Paraprevotella sp.]|nr:agmatine deiminase family protein [Paraprevotella sp.]